MWNRSGITQSQAGSSVLMIPSSRMSCFMFSSNPINTYQRESTWINMNQHESTWLNAPKRDIYTHNPHLGHGNYIRRVTPPLSDLQGSIAILCGRMHHIKEIYVARVKLAKSKYLMQNPMIFDSRTQLRASISAVKSTSTRTTSWHVQRPQDCRQMQLSFFSRCKNEICARDHICTASTRMHQRSPTLAQKGSASQVTSQLWSATLCRLCLEILGICIQSQIKEALPERAKKSKKCWRSTVYSNNITTFFLAIIVIFTCWR